ncbi:MAG: DUF4160 domain-containing protein [Paludibacter sp.]
MGFFIPVNFNDHNPPHFHARYEDFNGMFNIKTFEMFAGDLPKTAKKLCKTWAVLHRSELMTDWNLVRQGQNPISIKPLE